MPPKVADQPVTYRHKQNTSFEVLLTSRLSVPKIHYSKVKWHKMCERFAMQSTRVLPLPFPNDTAGKDIVITARMQKQCVPAHFNHRELMCLCRKCRRFNPLNPRKSTIFWNHLRQEISNSLTRKIAIRIVHVSWFIAVRHLMQAHLVAPRRNIRKLEI